MIISVIPNRRLCAAAFVILLLSACHSSDLPTTPFFAGVTGDYQKGTELLRGRLASRFPANSKVEELASYLEQQGMTVARSKRSAEVRVDDLVCGSIVSVDWQANDQGRLRQLNVLYSDSGCL